MAEKNKKHNNKAIGTKSGKSSPAKVTPKDVREEMSDIRKQISLFKQSDPEKYKKALAEAKNLNVSIVDYLFDSPILKQYKQIFDERRLKKEVKAQQAKELLNETVEEVDDISEQEEQAENNDDNNNVSVNIKIDTTTDDVLKQKVAEDVKEYSEITTEEIQPMQDIVEISVQKQNEQSENNAVDQNSYEEQAFDDPSDEVKTELEVQYDKEPESNNQPEIPADKEVVTENGSQDLSSETTDEKSKDETVKKEENNIEDEELDEDDDEDEDDKDIDEDDDEDDEDDEDLDDEESSDSMFINDEIDTNSAKYKSKKVKKGLFKTEEYIIAPEQALPDDITEADIAEEIKNVVTEEVTAEEDDEDNYEGMTEAEIAEAKERKRVLKELKQRYDAQGTKNVAKLGDYKKNLDFSVNTGIKRFRLKPPKKPFIISAIVLIVLLAASLVGAYFIVNKPPEPVHLASIKLSQNTTHQYVGENVDLRGLKIKCIYSDDSEGFIDVSDSMIKATSANIDDEYLIQSYNTNTYVTFDYEGYSVDLKIVLSQPTCTEINVEIYDQFVINNLITFDNILVLGKIVNSISGEVIGYKRFDSSILTIKAGSTEFEKTEEGFIVPEVIAGSQLLNISCEIDGHEFECQIENVIIYAS